MRSVSGPFLCSLFVLPLTVLGCSGSDDSGGGSEFPGTGGSSASGGSSGSAGSGGGGNNGGSLVVPDGGATGGTGAAGSGGGPGDPCSTAGCGEGQRCEIEDGAAACVDNECGDLSCSATEECALADDGGPGHVCRSIACNEDVDCSADRHCNGGVCVDDVCTPGTGSCSGDEVVQCESNGSAVTARYTCGSEAHFVSMCEESAAGAATCSCQDDWDCPAHTECEVGSCVGTGRAPTCSLPPVPFGDVPPQVEFQWGGIALSDDDARDGAGMPSPFARFSHVAGTPVVANLDDDNGDGLINELDFPEIVFTSYISPLDGNAVVRAVHGGGPNKGKDYFARCGDTLWQAGDDVSMPCSSSAPDGVSSGVVAVADLDGDGVPEVLYPTERNTVRVLNNRGELVTESAAGTWPDKGATVTVANLDNAGFAEVVVGRNVYQLGHDDDGALVFTALFRGSGPQGVQPSFDHGPMACVADLAGGDEQEIVVGTKLYRMPSPPSGVERQADCPGGDTSDYCTGTLEVVWNAATVNTGELAIPSSQRDGYCAVADVLGADPVAAPGPDNPPDGRAEVILIADGYLVILDGETGERQRFIDLAGGDDGGAPNIDDFDGDGFMEIATALSAFYTIVDLQEPSEACPAWPSALDKSTADTLGDNPARDPGGACTSNADCSDASVCGGQGQCVCLHNGWKRRTEDDSSRSTSSSVFDFNGDGSAEVVYNDECHLRVYDGLSGRILYTRESPSRTVIENPVVADVDNDGNAEIVTVMNTETVQCSEFSGRDDLPNGLRVWGDPTDTWVAARRIWNQQSYHVTNVTESGGILAHPPASHLDYNGRYYNTYRSQPRSHGVAPDLTVSALGVSAPGSGCSSMLAEMVDITFVVKNIGDLRVGPGVEVALHGIWLDPALDEPLYTDADRTLPLTATIQNSLEPGASVMLAVPYDVASSSTGTLPDRVRAVVDGQNAERECNEDNNQLEQAVDPAETLADLRVELGALGSCPSPTVPTTVYNDGTAPASGIVVHYYAGDPSQGGMFLHEVTVDGPLAPGDSATVTPALTAFPQGREITIYVVVDAAGAIDECNEANNKSASNPIACDSVVE